MMQFAGSSSHERDLRPPTILRVEISPWVRWERSILPDSIDPDMTNPSRKSVRRDPVHSPIHETGSCVPPSAVGICLRLREELAYEQTKRLWHRINSQHLCAGKVPVSPARLSVSRFGADVGWSDIVETIADNFLLVIPFDDSVRVRILRDGRIRRI